MKELQESTLIDIVNNYINGNRKDAWKAIKNLNTLQLAQLIAGSKHHGLKTHNLIAFIQIMADAE